VKPTRGRRISQQPHRREKTYNVQRLALLFTAEQVVSYTRAQMSSAARVSLDLEVSSWIEGRGVRHTNWSVGVNDALIPVGELREVERTATDPELSFHDDDVDELRVLPPGCQYRITYHLQLPVGTRVQRRTSTPLVQPANHKRAPETAEGAFQLMAATYGRKLPLKTTFTDFRVVPRGLVTEEQWQRRQQQAARDPRASTPQRRRVPVPDTISREDVEAFVRLLERAG